MEAVPRMPMLSFELKHSPEPVEFGPTLKQYIQEHYTEDPANYNKACTDLEQLRQNAIQVTHDFMGCSTLKKYYAQLCFLQSRFPMTEGGEAALAFTWEDVHLGREYVNVDIQFEKSCIMYNIGGLHSILGAMDTRQSAEGMKVSCTHFQCAAWAFEYLRDHFGCAAMSPDMSHEILTFHIDLMLAQAQECILEKSMSDNRKSTITAKVASQIVEFYKQALHNMEASNSEGLLSLRRYKYYEKRMELKILFYQTIMYFYMGNQSEEKQKWGERLAYLQASHDKLAECVKMAKNEVDDVQDSLRFTTDVVKGKYQAAKKDNDFVYHDKVPALNSLPEIKGASLVKGIPFNPNDHEVSGVDIFQKLVPIEAHEKSSLYSEEKAKLLRKVGSDVEEKDQELNQFMSSLQLDQSTLTMEPQPLPESLLEKCAAISVRQTAIKDLVEAMSGVSSLSTEVELGLNDLDGLMLHDKEEQDEFEKIFGKQAADVVLPEVRKESDVCLEQHKRGSQSNNELHKAMEMHISNLKLLSGPLDELQNMLRSYDPVRTPEEEGVVREVQRLKIKVDEMQSQRQSLHDELRKKVHNDDITNALVTHESADNQTFFDTQLKKHEKILGYLNQNMAAQVNVLHALTDANAKYATIRRATNDGMALRKVKIQELITSYDVYEDLMAKSQKGQEFYKKLHANVTRLLTRCQSVCKVHEEEREGIRKRFMPKAPPPSRPSAPKPGQGAVHPPLPMPGYSPEQISAYIGAGVQIPMDIPPASLSPQPTIPPLGEGPKLKDYLPFMKPKTFGKDRKGRGSPPVSSVPGNIPDIGSLPGCIAAYGGQQLYSIPSVSSVNGSVSVPHSVLPASGVESHPISRAKPNLSPLPPGYSFTDSPDAGSDISSYDAPKSDSTSTVSSIDTPIASPTKDSADIVALQQQQQLLYQYYQQHQQNLQEAGGSPVIVPSSQYAHGQAMNKMPISFIAGLPQSSVANYPQQPPQSAGYVYPWSSQQQQQLSGNQMINAPRNQLPYSNQPSLAHLPRIDQAAVQYPSTTLGQQQANQMPSSQKSAAPSQYQLPQSSSGTGQSIAAGISPYQNIMPGVGQQGVSSIPTQLPSKQQYYSGGQAMPTRQPAQYGITGVPSLNIAHPSPILGQNLASGTVAQQKTHSQAAQHITQQPQQQQYPTAVQQQGGFSYPGSVPQIPQVAGSTPLPYHTQPQIGQMQHQQLQQPSVQSQHQQPGAVLQQQPVSMQQQQYPQPVGQQSVVRQSTHPASTQQPSGQQAMIPQHTYPVSVVGHVSNIRPQAPSVPGIVPHPPSYQQVYDQQQTQYPSTMTPQQLSAASSASQHSTSPAMQNAGSGTVPPYLMNQSTGTDGVSHQISYEQKTPSSQAPSQQNVNTQQVHYPTGVQAHMPSSGQQQVPPGQAQYSLPNTAVAQQGMYQNTQHIPGAGVQPLKINAQQLSTVGVQPSNVQQNLAPSMQSPQVNSQQQSPSVVHPSSQLQQQFTVPASMPSQTPGQQWQPVQQWQPLNTVTPNIPQPPQQPVGNVAGSQQLPHQQPFQPQMQTSIAPSTGSNTTQINQATQNITYPPALQAPIEQTQHGYAQGITSAATAVNQPLHPSTLGPQAQGCVYPLGGMSQQQQQPQNVPISQSQSFVNNANQIQQTQIPGASQNIANSYQMTNLGLRESASLPQPLLPTPAKTRAGSNDSSGSCSSGSGMASTGQDLPKNLADDTSSHPVASTRHRSYSNKDVPASKPQSPVTQSGGHETLDRTQSNLTLSRQMSDASSASLDDILSSSPETHERGNATRKNSYVLVPKVLTAQEIQQQKDEALKLNYPKRKVRDPYDDEATLQRFSTEVEKFQKSIECLCKPKLSGQSQLDTIWKELMEEQEKDSRRRSMAVARCYIMKNRDPDIMPYDDTRIVLTTGKDDYINASWLNDLAPTCPKFIAAQAPLSMTLFDFWLMIHEQGTEVIVMVAKEDDPGKKIPVYWPIEKQVTVQQGPLELNLQSIKIKGGWTERIIYMKHNESKHGRTVVHLQYTKWPVSGFPEKIPSILEFISEVHSFYKQQRSLLKPVLVHCNNGVGRTGMFMVIYAGVQEINAGNNIPDIQSLILKMRMKRKHMISDKLQLKFCYDTILHHCQEILMKRGILTHSHSFGEKLSLSLTDKSHAKPEDLILGSPIGIQTLQSSVAKFGLKPEGAVNVKQTTHLDTREQETQNIPCSTEPVTSSISDKQTTVISQRPVDDTSTKLLLKRSENDESSHSEKLSTTKLTDDIEIISKQRLPDVVQNQQEVSHAADSVDMLSGIDSTGVSTPSVTCDSVGVEKRPVVSGSKTGNGTGSLSVGASPQHLSNQLQFSSLPPSLLDLQNPNMFTLDGGGSEKRRITKASFDQKTSGITESLNDPNDPLSLLDPLWSVRK